jgi:two-component system chemotaxis response regulator CheB
VGKIRVLVVEDSATVRGHLCDVLRRDDGIEVVGEGANGQEAVELCQSLRPDLITMDMMLPLMSGLEATEEIMARFPTPILIVSASTNRAELFKTYDALAAGAVDVLEKPRGDEPSAMWERTFLSTVKVVSRIRVITHHRSRRRPQPAASTGLAVSTPVDHQAFEVIAIGASTGGPAAIVDVLRAIPRGLSTPILLVLHISEPFGMAFAEWLGAQTTRDVASASDGQPISRLRGRVIMAPPGVHLLVRDGQVRLSAAPERHSCRPSIDVLFESVAREYGPEAVGCLLTGMGHDGAAGLLEVRARGGWTIAQDEASSVVYGMPREAALLGAAREILPLGDIGPALARLVEQGVSGRQT